jgi:hypothetical protein
MQQQQLQVSADPPWQHRSHFDHFFYACHLRHTHRRVGGERIAPDVGCFQMQQPPNLCHRYPRIQT